MKSIVSMYFTSWHHLFLSMHFQCIFSSTLLLVLRFNLNSVQYEQTALHHAAKNNDKTMVQLLLRYGADVSKRDKVGILYFVFAAS